MKIRYVIVDELPDSCLVCRLTEWRDEVKRAYCFCVPLGEKVDLFKYVMARPSNCPLRLERKK